MDSNQAGSNEDSDNEFGTSTEELMRHRTVIETIDGKEVRKQDLYCCGRQWGKAVHLNKHYEDAHADLPLSDPATWQTVVIKDRDAHARANLRLPFRPFPAKQRCDSTWTVSNTPRTPGTPIERKRKREEGRRSGTRKEVRILKLDNAALQRKIDQLSDELSHVRKEYVNLLSEVGK